MDTEKLAALAREHPANQPEGALILNDISTYLARFVAYPSEHCLVAHTLWIAHTHLMDVWDSTPRLAFLSPEPGSGKSRALEVTEPLVPRPVEAVNVSPAYLFRKVGAPEGRPTILHDEIDTVFGPKARDNEEIRGLLNAGHRKHSVTGRCVNHGDATVEIPAYCAVALAGLGNLPDTILTRAVVIRMRRRAPGEKVKPYRRRVNLSEAEALRVRLEIWAEKVESSLTDCFPDMPESIVDRDADVWESLVSVADAAGGDWPEKARVAAVTLVADSKDSTPSLGVALLKDLQQVFGGFETLSTEKILDALNDMDESPWHDLRGKALDSRGLARYLKPYGVSPTTVRVGEKTAKGYRREDLHDPWQRYLPAIASPESVTRVTRETDQPIVTPVTHVTHLREANPAPCPRCAGEGCGYCGV